MTAQKIKIWVGLFLLTIIVASGLGFAYGDQSNLYRGIEPLSDTARSSAATSVLNATDALTEVPVGPLKRSPVPSQLVTTTAIPVPHLPAVVSNPVIVVPSAPSVAAPCDSSSVPVIKDGKIVSCANNASATSCQSQGKLTYIGPDTPTLKHGQCIGG